MAATHVGRWAVLLVAAVWIELKSTLWKQTLLNNRNFENRRVQEQMGGNGPSHFPQEQDEGGGLTFLKGIRLSDKVIKRMKQSPTLSSPQLPQAREPPSPSNEPPSPDPTPSVENLTSSPPPSAPHAPPQETSSSPASPVSFYAPPPPVKFHSHPPPFVQEPTTTAPPLSAALAPPPPPATASPRADASVEHIPAAHTSVVPPQVEAETPPRASTGTEALVSPPPVQATVAPPPASEPVVATPPAATKPTFVAPPAEPVVPSMPELEMIQHQSSAHSPEGEPAVPPSPASSTPVEPAVLPLHVDQPLPEPAVEGAPPSPTRLAPPPPQPPATPSFSAELLNEEAPPRCHFVELPVVPTYTPLGEPLVDPPAPPPPDPAPPAEGPTMSLPPVVEDEAAAITSVPPPTEVLEEELRQKIKEEMQRRLEEEISQRREELQRQLEEMKVQVQAEAKAAAQAQVEEEVKKTLEAERAAHMETLTNSIMKERIKTGDQRLKLQLYRLELKAQQLEEREKELEKRDVLRKEHIGRLEAKYAEFKRATAEGFRKGKEVAENRFTRFSFQPVCGDLQSQILKCYRENAGKTLDCSNIASAYMQCVDHAKKNKLSTRG